MLDDGAPTRKATLATMPSMIHPRILRTLNLEAAPGAARPRHLSAGSGLVVVDDFIYVVADDELHLGCFRRSSDAAGSLVRLFPGDLPGEHAERKAAKPDLEALVRLPAFATYLHGALLAVPSGSTSQRCRGALLRLDASGASIGNPESIDFSPLFAGLSAQVPALNIEGSVLVDDALILLHRGSRMYPLSALIELSLPDVLAGLATRSAIETLSPRCVRWVDLGAIGGVALSITDGAALPDGRLVVAAVAEQSTDSYADGPCLGAVIGVLDRDGRVLQLHHLQPTYKIEGVQAWMDDGRIRMLMVTDADAEDTPSFLLEAELSATAQASAKADWLSPT